MNNDVAEFYAEIDRVIDYARSEGFSPPCCVGCFHCCYEAAYAAKAEIDYLVEGLTTEQKATVAERVQVWIQKAKPLLNLRTGPPHALQWRTLNLPCPLLEEGKCMAYSRRPFSCRTYFAKREAWRCETKHRATQQFSYFSGGDYAKALLKFVNQGHTVEEHIGVLLHNKLNNANMQSSGYRDFTSRI